MLVFKVFYFFFLSSWTAMLSYYPVYLKQVGLSASHTGILAGMAPILGGVGSGVLGFVADKTNSRNAIFLISLAANALTPTMYAIPQLQPNEEKCDSLAKNDSLLHGDLSNATNLNDTSSTGLLVWKTTSNLDAELKQIQSIPASEKEGQVFWILFVMTIIGEFLCGPSRNLADVAVLQILGSDSNNYGSLRSWGTIGEVPLYVLVSMLAITVPTINCFSLIPDNFAPALFLCSAYRTVAFACGLQIKFESMDEELTSHVDHKLVEYEKIRGLMDTVLTFRNVTFIVITFYLGVVDGQFFTFMFWYLEDVNSSQATWIMGAATIVRCIASAITYKSTGRIFQAIGVMNAVHSSLVMYIIAYVTYGLLQNPWLAIIPEVIQCAAYCLSMVACILHFAQTGNTAVASTLQGIVQFCYTGVGFGVGAMMTGPIIDMIGGSWTFLLFAAITAAMTMFSVGTALIAKYIAQPGNDYEYTALPMP